MVEDLKYFTESVDYPFNSNEFPYNILPLGVLWNYVDSSFANGFINHGSKMLCLVIDRYMIDADEGSWKQKKIAAFIENPPFHVDLSIFKDDVFILAHVGKDSYLFVWLDQDVSDCCIGRFETKDSWETIIAAVKAYGLAISQDHLSPGAVVTEIPLTALRGWLSF